jgi:hypothetical protein
VTDPIAVPLGRYLGMLPVEEPAGSALRHVVRAGGRRVVLSDDEHLVWALAHGIPGRPELNRWNRTAMRDNVPAGREGVDVDVDAVADRLVASGLLLEVAADCAPDEFARSVRLLPSALGDGNSEIDGRMFRIGYPGAPMAVVPTEIFYLWSFAGLETDLWTACVRAVRAALPLRDGDPRQLVRVLLDHLHVLLSPNLAVIDRAVLDRAVLDRAGP